MRFNAGISSSSHILRVLGVPTSVELASVFALRLVLSVFLVVGSYNSFDLRPLGLTQAYAEGASPGSSE